jgi:hypothetical protein
MVGDIESELNTESDGKSKRSIPIQELLTLHEMTNNINNLKNDKNNNHIEGSGDDVHDLGSGDQNELHETKPFIIDDNNEGHIEMPIALPLKQLVKKELKINIESQNDKFDIGVDNNLNPSNSTQFLVDENLIHKDSTYDKNIFYEINNDLHAIDLNNDEIHSENCNKSDLKITHSVTNNIIDHIRKFCQNSAKFRFQSLI